MKGCRNTAIFVPILVTIFVLIVHYGCGCRGKEKNITIEPKLTTAPSFKEIGELYNCTELLVTNFGSDTVAYNQDGNWVIKDSLKAIKMLYTAAKQWADQMSQPFVLIDDTKRDTFRYYNRDTIHINVRTQFEQITF